MRNHNKYRHNYFQGGPWDGPTGGGEPSDHRGHGGPDNPRGRRGRGPGRRPESTFSENDEDAYGERRGRDGHRRGHSERAFGPREAGHPGFEGGRFGAGPWTEMPGGGPRGGRGRGRGRRARRGDVRFAIVSVLSDGPSNGYGIIKAIEERTGGVWRTSPGSVYPTLAQLTDEGLVTPAEDATASGTAYQLTDAGRSYAKEHEQKLAKIWADTDEEWAEVGDFWTSAHKLMEALRQVSVSGSAEQRRQLIAKMDDLRKSAYSLLAE